ncbi:MULTISPECIES: hypothetical protein [unclassified Microbacterium]|uniref:hypothetical protein n=1 Tax=unclassified Microbacterium TaxID=2609290 RepID=UPI00300F8A4A
MITHDQVGADEDLAREVLVIARDIAPCLDSLAGEDEKNALAILRRVFKAAAARGSRFVKGQSIGSARVEYDVAVRSAFDGQPTRALRALCAARPSAAHSAGSFPTDRPVGRIWPERY